MTLEALLEHGYRDEATEWRDWLLRAVAGDPADLQIMYRVDGGRDLPERELDHLAGVRGVAPGPHRQRRRRPGAERRARRGHVRARAGPRRRASPRPTTPGRCSGTWSTTCSRRWREPDRGIWEVRGDPQHFTHSKVMAWAAVDRAVRAVEKHGLDGPVDRWRAERDAIHADVLAHALGRRARHVRAGLRRGAHRRGAAADGAGRLPAGGRPPHRVDPRRDPRRARDRARAAAPLPHGAHRRRRAPATSTRSSPARSGSPTPSPAPTTSTARPRCSTSWSAWPTTSGCWPSSTTRWAAGWRATCRRPCRTWRWSARCTATTSRCERARRVTEPTRSTIRRASVGPMDNNAYLLTCRRTAPSCWSTPPTTPTGCSPSSTRARGTPRPGRHDAPAPRPPPRPRVGRRRHRGVDGRGGGRRRRDHGGDRRPDHPAAARTATRLTSARSILEVIALRGHTPGSVAAGLHRARRTGARCSRATRCSPAASAPRRGPRRSPSCYDDVVTRLFDRFADDTRVYPGHGRDTTLGAERPHLAEWRARGW